MNSIKNLKPALLWKYFDDICKVPRPSKKEEKIIKFLLNFGKSNGLETNQDKAGNIVIRKAASPGKEKMKTVILQSHMDMVCEKLSEIDHDFDIDPIKTYIEDGWVKAKGTTLGADDGIGIAAQMAILSSDDIEHGPIECLFTVDEETGLTGAFALEKGFLKGDILINLDSEDEGELFIGCAGGIDTVAELNFRKESIPDGHKAYKIIIDGLRGGHSGDEIDKGYGNSLKIANRLLWQAGKELGLRICNFSGGKFRNAIPRDANATILLPAKNVDNYFKLFNSLKENIKNELLITEPGLKIKIEESDIPDFVIDKNCQDNLLNSLYACYHGVYTMSQSMKGMVETSTNLATIKYTDDKIIITTSQRSSVNSAKLDMAGTVESVFLLAGAKVTHTDGYPGWTPKIESEILNISKDSYVKLFGIDPIVRSIHAGLECGLFLEKYPELDMISFGPTLKGVHTPDEKIDIKTTQKFWDHLVDVLNNIPEKA